MKFIISLLFILITCCVGTWLFAPDKEKTEVLPFSQQYHSTVLLVPLDSRPACTDFVESLGKIAGIRVLTPPKDILDHYKQAGDAVALRKWCENNIDRADAAILSVDMLIHGGLLASRHATSTPNDTEETLRLLTRLHRLRPGLPIYAFHILPRLWPADNEENNKYQKEILAYSKLVDQVATFENPKDIHKLDKITGKVPAEILKNYRRVYQENLVLNKKLVSMAQSGTITQLIIGQDDSESFGIPNMTKKQLLHYIDQQGVSASRVIVTKGADEIAMTLLAHIDGQLKNSQPKINVQYADDGIPIIVMPYMANSIATTVKEKISLVNGIVVNTPQEADFILFVYVGSDRNVGYQYVANQQIQALIDTGHKVALIDLSEHFAPDETILPILMQNSARINQLIAYSGWNTASNSIGTAVAQAAIFTAGLKTKPSPEQKFTLYKNNLTFLTNRFIEDYIYLKESIDVINKSLDKEGTDVYDFKDRRLWASTVLKAEMINKVTAFKNSVSFNRPVQIPINNTIVEAKITDLVTTISYPWERTFEIKMNTRFNFEKQLDFSP